MALDWDKLRVFHSVAEAGSFTHAADKLRMSQSAVSRQISSLELEIGTKLFHRHPRGLMVTEPGESLFQTAHDMLLKLETVQMQLLDSGQIPSGKLRVTTTVAFGQGWLTDKIQEFVEIYPDMQIQLILDNEELDMNMREADCAIRLRQPHQPDLIQRRLFVVHLHVYAAPSYIERYGVPCSIEDLDSHRIITFGEPAPNYLLDVNWLEIAGRPPDNRRLAHLQINSQTAIKQACGLGLGIACLPDYIVSGDPGLVQLPINAAIPSFDTYFCYPDEMKNAAKLKAFRDFIVSKARNWTF